MAKLAVVGYCRGDTYLHVAPLCHIGGLSSALAALLAGAQQVFMPRCGVLASGSRGMGQERVATSTKVSRASLRTA
jgi:hypothetical protein